MSSSPRPVSSPSPPAGPHLRRDDRALGRRRVLGAVGVLVAAAAVIFVVGLVLGLAFVGRHGGGPIQGWDDQVERWMIYHRDGLVGVSKVIAFLGDAPKLAVVAVVASVILLLTIRSIRSLVPLVAYLGGEFEVFLIREIIHRHRPPTADYPAPHAVPGVHETSFSFPSGHSVAVTAIFFSLLGLLAITKKWVWPWALALLASLFVIDTRLILGVHWFSDVAFGLILGVAWGVTVAVVSRRVDWRDLRGFLPGR
jgi:membrane-associated phospholipid phosphatase